MELAQNHANILTGGLQQFPTYLPGTGLMNRRVSGGRLVLMSNVAYTIPNLIQGISQQPDAQRDPSQGEIQINGMSSIAEATQAR